MEPIQEYTEDERLARIEEWRAFFADPHAEADLHEFIERAGVWNTCALGTLARDRDIPRACLEHTKQAIKIYEAGGGEMEVLASSPYLFSLGTEFEDAIQEFDCAHTDGDTDAEADALERAITIFDKIERELEDEG